MQRRDLLAALAAPGSAALAGCDAAPPVGPTPTEDPRRTVRVGPGGPGCPGDSWGQMGAIPERVDEPVTDADDAAAVLAADEDRGGGSFSLVTPRPDGVEWKDRTVYVAERYDATDWFLFRTGGADLVGALVVALAGGGAEVVWFYVGAC